MSLVACQQDASLRELNTEVIGCAPTQDGRWRLQLSDTILYPEGGGQPADHGTINGIAVIDVQRLGEQVIHITEAPVPLGPCALSVDWKRRFDHMQQHTGQHLLTAIAQDQFGWPTVAFHLGDAVCTVELEVSRLSPAQLEELESTVNAEIRASHPVHLRWSTAEELPSLPVRTRGLPDGFAGPVRLVEIAGIDLNTCGGTHVSNTAEIQGITLLPPERIRGNVRLPFLAGGRIFAALQEAMRRERALSQVLSAPAEEATVRVTELIRRMKSTEKARKKLELELASSLGSGLAQASNVADLHRPGVDLSFLIQVANAALRVRPDLTAMLTTDEAFVVIGDPDLLRKKRAEILASLGGRGGGPPGRLQGKASNIAGRDEVLTLLQEHLASTIVPH